MYQEQYDPIRSDKKRHKNIVGENKMKVVLVILFNHRFDGNLDKLRQIYADRFTHLFFIVPFYSGDDQDVIAVFENSFYFQGYLAQALPRIQNDKFTHYLVIGDDLLLHPGINEHTYGDYFKLGPQTGFIPDVFLLHDRHNPRRLLRKENYWYWNPASVAFTTDQKGIEVVNELPRPDEARNLLSRHGYDFQPELAKDMLKHYYPILGSGKAETFTRYVLEIIRCAVFNWKLNRIERRTIAYPMVASYADIVIIPHVGVKKFCHYSGVFAALNLFVEIALPTALLFSVDSIRQEKDLNKSGSTSWSPLDCAALEQKFKLNIADLLAAFPDETLYMHPIKLSRWHNAAIVG
jgi:hypothetical protein